jgi:hypothetical protein
LARPGHNGNIRWDIVSRSSCVARMKVEKPPPDVLPIASNTYESNEFRNAKGYEREYSTLMMRTRCDGSATLMSTPIELVTPSLGENGEGRVVELPEANLDGLLGTPVVSEEGAVEVSRWNHLLRLLAWRSALSAVSARSFAWRWIASR